MITKRNLSMYFELASTGALILYRTHNGLNPDNSTWTIFAHEVLMKIISRWGGAERLLC